MTITQSQPCLADLDEAFKNELCSCFMTKKQLADELAAASATPGNIDDLVAKFEYCLNELDALLACAGIYDMPSDGEFWQEIYPTA
jgi:hypothetical protein